MSLELVDLPTIKVHPEVHALLKAQAHHDKRTLNDLVREILHTWASQKFNVLSMANDILKSKDMSEITGDWDRS